MLTIWIIHRDPHHRNALARMAAVGDRTVVGAPGDPLFGSVEAPDAAVLGLSGDFEQELEFVHRFGHRFPECAWLLLASPGEETQARQLFDTLDARHLSYPIEPQKLRRALRDGIQSSRADSLSSRRSRDELRARFGRWFGDLQRSDWMGALDPRLASVPVLIRGKAGTGRELLARYLHAFGGPGEELFLHVSSRGVLDPGDLADRFQSGGTDVPGRPLAVWLEDVDRLPLPIQRTLREWIEFGSPPGKLRGRPIRWMAGAADESELDVEPGLDPRLAETLSVLSLRTPSLGEQSVNLERFVGETALAWSSARHEAPRQFSAEALTRLRAHPWPGNLHELEAVVLRTLASIGTSTRTQAEAVGPGELRFSELREGEGLGLNPQTSAEVAPTDIDSGQSPRQAESVEEELSSDAHDDELTSLMPEGPPDSSDTEGRDILSFFESPEVAGADSGPAIDPVQMATDAALNTLAPQRIPDLRDSKESNLRRVIQSVAHAVRNPLVSIRTFAELLPERYEDPDFRDHFRELVGQDVARIDDAVTRLQSMVDLPDIEPQPVDLAHLLDKLLDEHADEIRTRRLLVLKELDHGLPHAYGDPMLLRDAFAGLLDRALSSVRDRGDIYIASKHHEGGRAGEPSVRILLRYSLATGASAQAASSGSRPVLPGGDNLATIMAQTIVQALGGSFTSDTTDADECVVIIDLPAPGPE
ncbi:MAG TPA: hypothetical protein EYQ66_11340 [Myxococcales bacterium]|nr:hypothetical protein [Myxococcales bacterium]